MLWLLLGSGIALMQALVDGRLWYKLTLTPMLRNVRFEGEADGEQKQQRGLLLSLSGLMVVMPCSTRKPSHTLAM